MNGRLGHNTSAKGFQQLKSSFTKHHIKNKTRVSLNQLIPFVSYSVMNKKSKLCCNQMIFSQLIAGLQHLWFPKWDDLFSDSLISIAPVLTSHRNWFYVFTQLVFDVQTKALLRSAALFEQPGFQPISSSVHSGVTLGQSQGFGCSVHAPEGEQQQCNWCSVGKF